MPYVRYQTFDRFERSSMSLGRHGGFGTSDNGLGLEPLDAPLPGDDSGLGPSSSTGEHEQESGVHL
jgi:hypothetical protein